MQDLLTRLRLDHQRLSKVLDQLEIVTSKVGEISETDSDLLFCLLKYLGEYPHEIHHPTEDVIFNEMLQKSLTDEQSSVVEGNARQHEVLEKKTTELLRRMDSLSAKDAEVLREYINLQRQHMTYEESVVFPLVNDVFSDADWQTVSVHQERLHDPLFDAAERRYESLYDCLGIEPEKIRARGADAALRFLDAT